MATLRAVLADGLIVVGALVTTLGVLGLFRFPDPYNQLHAASKAVVLGVVALLAACALVGDGATAARAGLVAVLLLLTTPVSAHVIARAAYEREEPLGHGDAIDESGQLER